jgi:CBS domain-containing protein
MEGAARQSLRTVADAMTQPAAVVERSATIQDASAQMLDSGTQAAVVVEGGRVCGVATARDVANALAAAYDLARTAIGEIAERDVPTARGDELLVDVHERMRAEGHPIVAVLGDDDEPIGVLEDEEVRGP